MNFTHASVQTYCTTGNNPFQIFHWSQEENDRLQKELHGDSTVAALQRQLAAAKAQIADLQKRNAELEEFAKSRHL